MSRADLLKQLEEEELAGRAKQERRARRLFKNPPSLPPRADHEPQDIALERHFQWAAMQPKQPPSTQPSRTAHEFDAQILEFLAFRMRARTEGTDDGRSIKKDERGNYQHPTSMLFRMGIESIRENEASQTFLELLEALAELAEKGQFDVLAQAFPAAFGPVRRDVIEAKNAHATIVSEFIAHVSETKYDESKSFVGNMRDVKHKFEISEEGKHDPAGGKRTIRRALKESGMDFPARGPSKPKSEADDRED